MATVVITQIYIYIYVYLWWLYIYLHIQEQKYVLYVYIYICVCVWLQYLLIYLCVCVKMHVYFWWTVMHMNMMWSLIFLGQAFPFSISAEFDQTSAEHFSENLTKRMSHRSVVGRYGSHVASNFLWVCSHCFQSDSCWFIWSYLCDMIMKLCHIMFVKSLLFTCPTKTGLCDTLCLSEECTCLIMLVASKTPVVYWGKFQEQQQVWHPGTESFTRDVTVGPRSVAEACSEMRIRSFCSWSSKGFGSCWSFLCMKRCNSHFGCTWSMKKKASLHSLRFEGFSDEDSTHQFFSEQQAVEEDRTDWADGIAPYFPVGLWWVTLFQVALDWICQH